MPDIFDEEIPDLDEGELPVPEDDGGDVFSRDIPDLEDMPLDAAPREPGTGHWAEDALLGLADGMTLGHGHELGRVGDLVGNGLADIVNPRPEGATVAGQQGVSDELYDRAQETGAGRGAKLAGRTGVGVLAALAAGPGLGAQALAGGLTGATAADGDGEDVAGGAMGGALAGLAGGLAGKAASGVAGWLGTKVPVSLPFGQTLSSGDDAFAFAQSAGLTPTRAEEALLELAKAQPSLAQTFMAPFDAAKNWAGRGAISLAAKAAEAAPWLRGGVAALAGPAASKIGSALGESKAKAQTVAYAGEPTMSWAVQSILTQGNSQLPPEAEQRLTEAVMSGDTSRVISENFRLQQKYAGYAKRYQDEVTSLQNQE